MTAVPTIDAMDWLRKQVEGAPDAMREALAAMLMTLMNAEVDSICGAEYGERHGSEKKFLHSSWSPNRSIEKRRSKGAHPRAR